jgi:hypothetical protein
MIDPASIVPPPHPNDHKISPWIDEQIWGHRLWDSESPWLLFLEFLSVAEACHRDGTLLMEDGRFRPLAFKPYKRMYLRNILFNNEEMLRIAERYSDSASAWTAWLASRAMVTGQATFSSPLGLERWPSKTSRPC